MTRPEQNFTRNGGKPGIQGRNLEQQERKS
jgi:hypothetical protein